MSLTETDLFMLCQCQMSMSNVNLYSTLSLKTSNALYTLVLWKQKRL